MPSGTSPKNPSNQPSTGRKIRLRVDPQLTPTEIRKLEARAAEDLRGLGNYVAWLIAQDLTRKPKARRATGATPTDRRQPYNMAIPMTTADRERLRERADAEMRSISSYVAVVILESFRRG